MPTYRPILDRLLVRRLPAPTVDDGFQVPEKYRQHNNLGKILALGQGIVLGNEWHSLTEFVQVGQTVLFGEYTAEKLELDGKEDDLYVIRLQDVRLEVGE